jgi:hypothetical protein
LVIGLQQFAHVNQLILPFFNHSIIIKHLLQHLHHHQQDYKCQHNASKFVVFPIIPSLAINDGFVVSIKTPNACASLI